MNDAVTCPCCGYQTLSESGAYEGCRVCYWEDDLGQRDDPDSLGANGGTTLREGQKSFRQIGACHEVPAYMGSLEKRLAAGWQRDPDWQPLEAALIEWTGFPFDSPSAGLQNFSFDQTGRKRDTV